MNDITKNKKYASIGNPTINAVIKQLYRFETTEQANTKARSIVESFVVSSKNNYFRVDPNAVIIWITGFELSDEEIEKGYLGNYAALSVKSIDDDLYTVVAEKLPAALDIHPQKKRPKQRHPDWGHRTLRDIKKKKIYFTLEEVKAELEALQIEYPEVSIPINNGLLIIVYEKSEDKTSLVKKYKLTIKLTQEGAFYIECSENEKKQLVKTEEKKQATSQSTGYFTSLVSLKKKRKPTA